MHYSAPSVVHFASLDEANNSGLSSAELYGRSTLAIILGVKYGMVERVIQPNNDNIYALSVHPGTVRGMAIGLS
ncbi:short-chain dehydrogenase [Apiospora arundinis]